MIRTRRRLALAFGVATALAVTIGGTQVAGGATDRQAAASGYVKKSHYTFVVSNNFLGNDYRPAAAQACQADRRPAALQGQGNLKVVESQPTTAAQLADLNNIISEQARRDSSRATGPDRGELRRSSARAPPGSSSSTSTRLPPSRAPGRSPRTSTTPSTSSASGWARRSSGKGSVFVDHGSRGPEHREADREGLHSTASRRPPRTSRSPASTRASSRRPRRSRRSRACSSGNPDVNGIHNQGYCTPVFNARGRGPPQPVPATCFAYNGEVQACAKPGRQCAIETGAPTGIQIAMKTALDILDGKTNPPKNKVIPNPRADLRHQQGVVPPEEDVRDPRRPDQGRRSAEQACRPPARSAATCRPGWRCRSRCRSTRSAATRPSARSRPAASAGSRVERRRSPTRPESISRELALSGIAKSFGGVVALRGVDLTVRDGRGARADRRERRRQEHAGQDPVRRDRPRRRVEIGLDGVPLELDGPDAARAPRGSPPPTRS